MGTHNFETNAPVFTLGLLVTFNHKGDAKHVLKSVAMCAVAESVAGSAVANINRRILKKNSFGGAVRTFNASAASQTL